MLDPASMPAGPPQNIMTSLFKWQFGRQSANYSKFTLLFSKKLGCDAYIVKIPKGSFIPRHTDPVKNAKHYRMNLTFKGRIRMETDTPVFKVGNWFYFFRPDIVLHWANAVEENTYILSIGWLR